MMYKATDFYSKAVPIAHYYGFQSLSDITHKRRRAKRLPTYDRSVDSVDGKLSRVAKLCCEHNLYQEGRPIAMYHTSIDDPKAPKSSSHFGLQVYGVTQSIGEAYILRSACSILEDLEIDNVLVRVNSIGDKDSSARFARELGLFFRKHIADLEPSCRQALKKSPFDAFAWVIKNDSEMSSRVPKPLEYLSKESRRRFRDTLEHLETAEVPYEIDETLVANRDCYSDTIFSITKQDVDEFGDATEASILAQGGRHDEFSRKHFRTTLPAVGLVFFLPKKGRETVPKLRIPRRKSAFFVHFGPEAQRRSLSVMEMLRHKRVPISQAVGVPQLSEQLKQANDISVKYVVIMGQKEVQDGTVIVRDSNTLAQETISLSMLPDYLKTHR